jgi:hypothetical protein
VRQELVVEARRIAGKHERCVNLPHRVDEAIEVLVRAPRRDAQHQRTVAELQARAQLALGSRARVIVEAGTERNDIDLRRIDAEVVLEIGTGRLRAHDNPP